MSVRVALGVLLVHVATMFGVLVAGGTPEQCEESRNLLCGTPLSGFVDEAGKFKLSLNPLAIVGAFNGILTLFKGALIYDYALLNESSNIIAIIWVWGVRLVFALIGLRMLNQAFPQIGNVLARLR